MNRIKRIFQNILLIGFSIIISLILFEIGIRIFLPQRTVTTKPEPPHPRNLYINDKDLGYCLNPNFKGDYKTPEFEIKISINSSGLRDEECKEKKSNEYRILVLGDSFTFGWGVEEEETFAKKLERILNEKSGSKIYRVINAGILGYDTDQELKYLKIKGSKLNPDLVLLGFYINDINENFAGTFNNRVVMDGYLFDKRLSELYEDKLKKAGKDLERAKIPMPFKKYLQEKSQGYTILHNMYNQFLIKMGIRKSVDISRDLMLEEYNIYLKDLYLRKNEKLMEDANRKWNLTINLLNQLADEAKAENLKLAVIVIPANYQVYANEWGKIINLLELNPEYFDLTLPVKRIDKFSSGKNIPVINLLPEFIEKGKSEKLYFPVDGHWNAEGHKLAAELIFNELIKQTILN